MKLSELWASVEDALSGDRAAGVKFAVIEAHKILESTLSSLGYPGRNIERQLYWAGYSLEEENGIKSALDKREEILRHFDFPLSDLEAADIVAMYKKVVHEIVQRGAFGWQKKVEAFYKVYLSPKSVYTWRNLAVAFGFFLSVKLLRYTESGKGVADIIVKIADMALSWITLAIIIAVSAIVVFALNYRDKRTKIKIKE